MVRHLPRSLCLAAIAAAALFLQGCGNSVPLPPERASSRPPDASSTEADSHAGGTTYRARAHVDAGRTGSKALTAVSTLAEQSPAEDVPAWLDELLHSPDPNVRIQALDAWARQPTASLNPVTYALVDPDESVRARAQEVLEHELVRR
jgi:hypothetical protein